MRLPHRRRHAARRRPLSLTSSFLTISSLASIPASAITFTPAPAADLDLSQLGRVAIAGDFSGISLYQFEEQSENPFSTNGSESLLARLPNGNFASIIDTDASIEAMCTFILNNGSMAGVVLGGNFTSLGQLESPAIALFNPNTSEITPLSGMSGQVNALLCDQDTNTVYVGGNFKALQSTNAIAWYGSVGWQNLPFAGFNGPVSSITKSSNGHVIFGGSFSGLGNASAPSEPDGQIINLATATITSGSSTTKAGFSNPSNIVCKTSGADGAGNTWLLEDNTPGFWQASFDFGFEPTKLRLWNTRQDGRGTKTWRLTALPINGIMNFTYIDPATGQNASCTNECPLSNAQNSTFQDFHFVNVIGMNSFRIDISDFYGSGGGLDGIELYENDIFAYAINNFNEPTCAGISTPSSATPTGPWVVTQSHSSVSQYLTAQLAGPVSESSASIVFSPDIKEGGFYSVNLYTPGCIQDNTCSTRGQIHVTGTMAADASKSTPLDVFLYQTNNFDKYDQIYFGYMDASSGSFRPSVTMTPKSGQDLSSMTFVAQRVGFTVINSTGGLNGLFEYNPSMAVINTTDFANSAFDTLGSGFSPGSAVNALATAGDVTYIGGNFTSSKAKNIISINSQDASVESLDGGLNGEVLSMVINGTNLFVGGQFSNTLDNSATGLNNVAVFDTSQNNSWSSLGAGVNGAVLNVVPLTMNVTSTTPEVVISFSGEFSQLEAFGSNPAVSVNGFGIWVPSQQNWLNNLDVDVESISGILSTSLLDIPGVDALYGGSISSSSLNADGAATLGETLGRFPVTFQPTPTTSSPGSLSRRDTLANSTLSGVVAGLFYSNGGRNVTIFGGHFTANSTNGTTINNLLFINGSNNDAVSGVGSQVSDNSTFVALAVQEDTLFAGGSVFGNVNGDNVNGLITFDLASNSFNIQPPALVGSNVSVSAISVQPSTGNVYVGGSFDAAGSLDCPAVCYFSTTASQWNRPGQNLEGTATDMFWASATSLVAGGALQINGSTPTFLATYDSGKQTWDAFPGATALPGPVDVLTAGSSDGTQVWAAGTASNGSVYVMKYDGSHWNSAGETLGPGTDIRSLQVFSLTQSHDSTPLLDSNQILMLTGSIIIPDFGAASAAIFNGTSFEPFALTTNEDNTAGTIARIFSENQNFFTTGGGGLPLVFIVLIGLGISLALMLLIVVAGLFLDRLRKRREGYVPAPTSMYDRGSGLQRVPPEELLQSLRQAETGRTRAPQV